ncbi:HPP family protein [Pseudochelatococcus sp. G4_1912]|uniref:HPP family protein n=1 Tax=Pseudochelatococcus sp. G4_1912 TaxID=3114288 RepID=UPI0039C65BD5
MIDKVVRVRAYPIARRTEQGILIGCVSALVIFTLCSLSEYTNTLLVMASFGASCVIVFTLPQSPLAQPSNVIGGHVLSAIAGFAALFLFGQTPFSMGLGVGLAIIAMAITATLHPPGAGNPILIIGGGYPLWYLLTPVFIGAVTIVLAALFYHRFISGHIYPVRKV